MILPLSTLLDDLASVAVIVGAGATVALFFAAVGAGRIAERSIRAAANDVQTQIQEQRKIEERRRVYDHLATFNSRHFTETSVEALNVFQLFKRKPATEATWKRVSPSEKAAMQTVLNFYEEIANEYNSGFLDAQVSQPLVFVAVVVWRQAEELIDFLRREDPRFLEQWRVLYLVALPTFFPDAAQPGTAQAA
jgi:hypothetical protein